MTYRKSEGSKTDPDMELNADKTEVIHIKHKKTYHPWPMQKRRTCVNTLVHIWTAALSSSPNISWISMLELVNWDKNTKWIRSRITEGRLLPDNTKSSGKTTLVNTTPGSREEMYTQNWYETTSWSTMHIFMVGTFATMSVTFPARLPVVLPSIKPTNTNLIRSNPLQTL